MFLTMRNLIYPGHVVGAFTFGATTLATAAIHFASHGNDTQVSNAHLLSQPDPSNIPRCIVLLHTIDFLVLIGR